MRQTFTRLIATLLLGTLLGLSPLALADDAAEITHAMKAAWDKPEQPLTVKPVVIVDQIAVAGWLQQDRGGRALLKKTAHGWQTQLCAGEMTFALLHQAGASHATANKLLKALSSAEQSTLSANERKQLDSFSGVVKMDGNGQHGHHAEHGQPTHQNQSH
jgi:hypothetical protein